jgi:hypothetical protein
MPKRLFSIAMWNRATIAALHDLLRPDNLIFKSILATPPKKIIRLLSGPLNV